MDFTTTEHHKNQRQQKIGNKSRQYVYLRYIRGVLNAFHTVNKNKHQKQTKDIKQMTVQMCSIRLSDSN